jgi:hypothetical protein
LNFSETSGSSLLQTRGSRNCRGGVVPPMTPPRRLSWDSWDSAAQTDSCPPAAPKGRCLPPRPRAGGPSIPRAFGRREWSRSGHPGKSLAGAVRMDSRYKEVRPKEPTRCVSLDVISATSRRSAPSGATTTLRDGRGPFNRVIHLFRRSARDLSTGRPPMGTTCPQPARTATRQQRTHVGAK